MSAEWGSKIALRALLCAAALITGCVIMQMKGAEPGPPESGALPEPEREFRAAWIATVANINWPSQPGLSTAEQQREAVALLDLLAENNFNAAVFQARPQCDAFYSSQLEPWSYYLTGVQGQAPEPYYDPLEFWVEEAHRRGIELHVWLNPYRAHHVTGGEVTEYSIVEQRPELVVKLESGYYWMDPAKQGTQDHSLAVVMNIVERYDIPQRFAGGANPRGKPWNEVCGGVEIMLTDPAAYRSVEAALHIIDACRRTSPDSLTWAPPAMIGLLDRPGMTVEGVVEKCREEVTGFAQKRKKYLLYR